MSEWSVALEAQADLWRRCRSYRSFEDMRAGLWGNMNLDDEVAMNMAGENKGSVENNFYKMLTDNPATVSPYYFNRPCSELLIRAAPAFPVSSVLPSADRMLSQAGFWYFSSSPWTFEMLDTSHRSVRACLWYRMPDALWFLVCIGHERALIPLIFFVWPVGSTIASAVKELAATFEKERQHPSNREAVVAFQHCLQVFGAGVSFCHQRIFLDSREPADRATRRRVADCYPGQTVPAIHVITLRRAVTKEPTGEAREVDWQWRWWVRGHWRQQAVGPGHQYRTPIWISPYVKGPDARPLKPLTPSVFSVVR